MLPLLLSLLAGAPRMGLQAPPPAPIEAATACSRGGPGASRRAAVLAWGLLLAGLGAALAWWTWGRTLDVLIDYGSELYVAWRLQAGDVLYRDLAYFTGPLSPYLNALLFRLLGTGIATLAGANLAAIAAIAALLFALTARLGGLLAAGAATLLFLCLSAFGHLSPYGTYNFVTPYSHETVHGTLLSLAALLCLARWLDRPRWPWLAATGLACGLVLLTKPELLLAAALASAAGLCAGAWVHRLGPRRTGACAALILGCALVPVLAAWALLATAMPAGEALRGSLGSWPHLLDGEVAKLPFYRSILGTDRLAENLAAMGLGAAGLLALCGLAFAASLIALPGRTARAGAAALAFVVVAGVLYASVSTASLAGTPDGGYERAKGWLELARPLPLVSLLGALASAWRLFKGGTDGPRWALGLAWCVFALALQAKILFNVHLEHYGYALAMPATAVLVLALLGWLPELARSRGGNGAVVAAAGAGMLVALLAALLPLQQRNLAWQHVRVGAGADAFLADERGLMVEKALRALERRHGGAGTLLVLPEGAMINYLARRRMPARHLSYMPPELIMFGEEAMLADLRARPPEVVTLVHRVTREYGTPLFGTDYGRRLAAWVREEYVPSGPPIGDPPLRPESRFGIQILARRGAQAGTR